MKELQSTEKDFIEGIKTLLKEARKQVVRQVNTTMLMVSLKLGNVS